MNEHFITGFVKAAQAAGMSEAEIEALLKQAEPAEMQEQMPAENAESPMEEAPMEEAPMANPAEDQELEQLLSQLSPEEIEQLASELANEMQGGQEGSSEMEQLPELAAAIEQQLGQNPEVAEALAPSPEMTEETMAKQSAINFIKSAEYVEGFLEQAVGRGMNLKQAVELYDTAFSATLNQLKTSELKGDQHKLDVDGDGKIEADDLKKLREDKKKEAEMIDEKTAAYYEGVIERCREYGMTDDQAIEFVKSSAAVKIPKKAPSMAAQGRAYRAKLMNKIDTGIGKSMTSVKDKPVKATAIGTAVGAGAGLAGGYALGNSKKED